MSIDIQVMLTFFIFMIICVATNKDMSVKEFKSQILMVMMSGIGWAIFKLINIANGFYI